MSRPRKRKKKRRKTRRFAIVQFSYNTKLSPYQDLIDPATAIKEACAENHCTAYKAKLDECNDRVRSKNKTTETCFEEILDFYHCVDHCAAQDVFKVRARTSLYSVHSLTTYLLQHVK